MTLAVVQEAFRFAPVFRAIGACAEDAPLWFLKAEHEGRARIWSDDETPYCMIETTGGRIKAEAGDWIVLGANGELSVSRDRESELLRDKYP
jgi:hypothetical protein